MTDSPSAFPSPADETDPVRRDIRAAMNRLLGGTSLRANPGELTVVALAREAYVKRHHLTHGHTDLRDEFVAPKGCLGSRGHERPRD